MLENQIQDICESFIPSTLQRNFSAQTAFYVIFHHGIVTLIYFYPEHIPYQAIFANTLSISLKKIL